MPSDVRVVGDNEDAHDVITTFLRSPGHLIEHSIQGYLSHCQDQLPNLDLPYLISGNESMRMSEDNRWHTLASLWKQHTQEMRRMIDEDAAKNEPHRGEPGQGGFGSHPRLTPYETERALEALLEDPTEWNLDENDDDE